MLPLFEAVLGVLLNVPHLISSWKNWTQSPAGEEALACLSRVMPASITIATSGTRSRVVLTRPFVAGFRRAH